MKLREDFKIITSMFDKGLISIKEAKELSAASLLIIPDMTGNVEYSQLFDEFSENINKIHFTNLPLIDQVLIIYQKNTSKDGVVQNKIYYNRIKVIDEDTIEWSHFYDDTFWLTTKIKNVDGKLSTFIDFKVKFNNKKMKIKPWYKEDLLREMKDLFIEINILPTILSIIISYVTYNTQRDYYAIAKTEDKKPFIVKQDEKKIAKVIGPRIIYLDKLPNVIDNNPENVGMGSPKAAHQRRGTWVTLRAERYKNHPLYQVEKGIYRKPAWVGDRSTIVHGATYTVVDREIKINGG